MADAVLVFDLGRIEADRGSVFNKKVYFFDTYAHALAANQAYDTSTGDATTISGLTGIGSVKYVEKSDGTVGVDIRDVSRSAAAKITWPAHQLKTGETVVITGVTQDGYTDLVDTHTVTVIDENTFSVPIDTTDAAAAYDADTDAGIIASNGGKFVRVDTNGNVVCSLDNGSDWWMIVPNSANGPTPVFIPAELLS